MESLQKQLDKLRRQLSEISSGASSNRFGGSSGSGGGTYDQIGATQGNKCMSTGATMCIVLVVILVVGVIIAGIVFTLQNRMPPEEILIVNGGSGDSVGGGGLRPVSLAQHHRDTRQTQAQDAKRVSEVQASEVAERKRRDAAQAAMQKAHAHGGVRGGLPAMRMGGGSSPRPTAMAHRMAAQSTTASHDRLMADAQTLPRAQPQMMARQPAQASEPPASVHHQQTRVQTRMQARSAVGTSLSPMRKSNGTPSTRLATGGGGGGAAGGSHIANIRKSLAASNAPAHKASSNSNRFLAGVPGTTSYFAPGNATIIARAKRIAQDLKDGRRCGPGGAGMPDAAIAAYAEDDAPPCL